MVALRESQCSESVCHMASEEMQVPAGRAADGQDLLVCAQTLEGDSPDPVPTLSTSLRASCPQSPRPAARKIFLCSPSH